MMLPRDRHYADVLMSRKSYFVEQGSFGRGTCFIGLTLRDFVSLLKALVEAEVSYEELRASKKHSAATIFE